MDQSSPNSPFTCSHNSYSEKLVLNRNMSHSLICNRVRSNFEFVVTQLTDKSPNFTEPENSELHSQKFATGPILNKWSPVHIFTQNVSNTNFICHPPTCTKVFQMVFPFVNSPTTLCTPFSLSHAIWMSHQSPPSYFISSNIKGNKYKLRAYLFS